MNIQTKTTIGASIIIVALAAAAGFTLTARPQLDFTPVTQENITQGLNLKGTVTAADDLSLAFENGGIVSEVNVKAGDHVKQGQILVRLDSAAAAAAVKSAQSALNTAKATYQKLLNGATSQTLDVSAAAVATAQTALENATKQQQLAVDNAYKTLLNSGLAAIPGNNNTGSVAVTVTGSYTGTEEGSYNISLYASGNGMRFKYSGLETGDGMVDTSPEPLGSKGLYLQFSASLIPGNNTWTINIPNTQSAAYTANLNAYNAALQNQQSVVQNAQAALNQAQAAYALTKTPARQEDLDSAQAAIEAAQANLENAQNTYNKRVIAAPVDGVITSVDAKVGQNMAGSTAMQAPSAVTMISNKKFQIITYVSQADVGKIKIGDQSNVTLDAYGTGAQFPATVLYINPAATVQQGITTYKTTLEFINDDDRIKEGMNANIIITDDTHNNILAVPQSSLITQNGKTYVLLKNGQQAKLQEVTAGLYGLNNNVEISTGLSLGQNVAYFGK